MSTLRFITAGESHGKGLLAVLEGLPAGLTIDIDAINKDLFRRQQGYGRGGRMKIEKDEVELLAGVRHGQTTGAPVVLWVRNKDWENWKDAMAPEPIPDGQGIAEATVTRPRPGHADLPGALKYGWYDVRNILERSSARETVARVAAGAVAKRLLAEFGVTIISHVIQIGSVAAPSLPAATLGLSRTDYRNSGQNWAGSGEPPGITERLPGSQDTSNRVDEVPGPLDYSSERSQDSPKTSDDSGSDTHGNQVFLPGLDSIVLQIEASPVRCADPESSRQMVAEIDRAAANGDSLGGIFEVIVTGLPPGLGSHVEWDRRIDGLLAQALMSIQAIKGVEIGEGFALASKFGSSVHDEIYYDGARGFYRLTNHAGGVEGGITNGEPLIIRAAMKPIPTLRRPLQSADTVSKEVRPAALERSDICAVPAAAVAGEAMTALILASAWLEKFGGDSLVETRRNYEGYLEQLRRY